MSKLFEVIATPKKRVYKVVAYSGNRIAVKLMRLIESGGVYNVKRLKSDNKDLAIFEVSIISRENKKRAFELFILEIESYIPDNFPRNYLFAVDIMKLGFTHSFTIQDEQSGENAIFCHKIKEINRQSIMPTKQIYK